MPASSQLVNGPRPAGTCLDFLFHGSPCAILQRKFGSAPASRSLITAQTAQGTPVFALSSSNLALSLCSRTAVLMNSASRSGLIFAAATRLPLAAIIAALVTVIVFSFDVLEIERSRRVRR